MLRATLKLFPHLKLLASTLMFLYSQRQSVLKHGPVKHMLNVKNCNEPNLNVNTVVTNKLNTIERLWNGLSCYTLLKVIKQFKTELYVTDNTRLNAFEQSSTFKFFKVYKNNASVKLKNFVFVLPNLTPIIMILLAGLTILNLFELQLPKKAVCGTVTHLI